MMNVKPISTYELRTKHVISSYSKLPKGCHDIELQLVNDARYDIIEELWIAYSEEYYG